MLIPDAGARPLTQSMAILAYLEERFPTPPLLPADAWLRARARQLAEMVNAGIQPLQNLPTMERIRELGADPIAWSAPLQRARARRAGGRRHRNRGGVSGRRRPDAGRPLPGPAALLGAPVVGRRRPLSDAAARRGRVRALAGIPRRAPRRAIGCRRHPSPPDLENSRR